MDINPKNSAPHPYTVTYNLGWAHWPKIRRAFNAVRAIDPTLSMTEGKSDFFVKPFVISGNISSVVRVALITKALIRKSYENHPPERHIS